MMTGKSVIQVTTDKIMGKAKGVQRPAWMSLQTLKLADERRNLKRKRRKNVKTSKHYNYLCRQSRNVPMSTRNPT